MTIETFWPNLWLFELLKAGDPPRHLALAEALAAWPIWLVPMLLLAVWFRGGVEERRAGLAGVLTALLALGLNQLVDLAVIAPRPFAAGLSPLFLPHAADSSFASDHLTAIWSVAAGLLLFGMPRTAALAGLVGLPVAWGRIYLGLHYPMDMAGAALLGLMTAAGLRLAARPAVAALADGCHGLQQQVLRFLLPAGRARRP